MNKFEFGISVFKAVKEGGKHYVVGKASDDKVDAYRDRFSREALQMMLNDVLEGVDLLRNHYDTFEIGKTSKKFSKLTDKNELIVGFELNMAYPESVLLFTEVETGKCERQLSVGGFIPLDDDAIDWEERDVFDENGNRVGSEVVRVIKKMHLDHIAATRKGWAANPRTGFMEAVMQSLDGKRDNELDFPIYRFSNNSNVKLGSAVPIHDGKVKAKEEEEWVWNAEEGNKILDKGGWGLYKEAHAWFDDTLGSVPEKKLAYKLPHHKIVDGKFSLVLRGVFAAMASLLGARGGVKIPDEERKSVYNHLAHHYAEFNRVPPEFKSYSAQEFVDHHILHRSQDVSLLKSIFGEIDENGKLKAKGEVEMDIKETLKSILDAIQSLLHKTDEGAKAGEESNDVSWDNIESSLQELSKEDLELLSDKLESLSSAVKNLIGESREPTEEGSEEKSDDKTDNEEKPTSSTSEETEKDVKEVSEIEKKIEEAVSSLNKTIESLKKENNELKKELERVKSEVNSGSHQLSGQESDSGEESVWKGAIFRG